MSWRETKFLYDKYVKKYTEPVKSLETNLKKKVVFSHFVHFHRASLV